MGTDLIDFHTHILPCLDDGSKSVEMSLSMLREETEQGVRHVVLTPHFYARHDDPDRFLASREAAAEALKAAVAEVPGLPTLHLGAEVAYFRGMSDCEILRDFCIGRTECILVELPMTHWDGQIYRELGELRSKQGLIPIVAHVDRYLSPLSANRVMASMQELPVLLQANSSFFLRRGTASMALRMLRRGQIQLLGSDCHDLTERAPNLGKAAERICRSHGEGALQELFALGMKILSPVCT